MYFNSLLYSTVYIHVHTYIHLYLHMYILTHVTNTCTLPLQRRVSALRVGSDKAGFVLEDFNLETHLPTLYTGYLPIV